MLYRSWHGKKVIGGVKRRRRNTLWYNVHVHLASKRWCDSRCRHDLGSGKMLSCLLCLLVSTHRDVFKSVKHIRANARAQLVDGFGILLNIWCGYRWKYYSTWHLHLVKEPLLGVYRALTLDLDSTSIEALSLGIIKGVVIGDDDGNNRYTCLNSHVKGTFLEGKEINLSSMTTSTFGEKPDACLIAHERISKHQWTMKSTHIHTQNVHIESQQITFRVMAPFPQSSSLCVHSLRSITHPSSYYEYNDHHPSYTYLFVVDVLSSLTSFLDSILTVLSIQKDGLA